MCRLSLALALPLTHLVSGQPELALAYQSDYPITNPSSPFAPQAAAAHCFVMYERAFVLSDYYYIDSAHGSLGNIVKTKLSFGTNYIYYDQQGEQLAGAYLRVFSLGALFTWASVMDVYDENERVLGRIEGSLMTFLPSKFYFYSPYEVVIGVAYMDNERMGFTVVDANNEAKIIAQFNRIFVKDVTDHWEIKVNDYTCDPIRGSCLLLELLRSIIKPNFAKIIRPIL